MEPQRRTEDHTAEWLAEHQRWQSAWMADAERLELAMIGQRVELETLLERLRDG